MSLNDALFADLESDDDIEHESEITKGIDVMKNETPTKTANVGFLDEKKEISLFSHDLKPINDFTSVSYLMNRLGPILHLIDTTVLGDSTEYSLLVEANSYSVGIDSAILVVHQFIKERYRKRFSELETLVQPPVEYAKAVLAIGNNIKMDSVTSNESVDMNLSQLKLVVSPATFMVISMASYESKGEALTNTELKDVMSACELLLSLKSAKDQITQFVSSRLAHFAPNITAVLDPHTIAQLLGASGGLKNLAATPSSNIPSLGSKSMISNEAGQPPNRNRGFLYYSPIVQNTPPELRTQAMRIISGKLVLAARVDFSNSISKNKEKNNDEYGKKLRKEILEKLERLLEPPENKSQKALPVPVDAPSKKRAGKRIRKFKEQHKMTELQRVQNRVTFGVEETYDSDLADLGGSLGTKTAKNLLNENPGKVRVLSSDKGFRGKISKGMANRLQRLDGKGLGMNKKLDNDYSSGIVSSVNFSQFQGIELVDPSKIKEESSKPPKSAEHNDWFKSGAFSLHHSDVNRDVNNNHKN